MSDFMLRVPELAERLDVSEQSVYRLLSSGALPGIRVGGVWRVPAEVLDRWINEQLSDTRGLPPAPPSTEPRAQERTSDARQKQHSTPRSSAIAT
jgi:excisionase family DNA binding protein